MILLAIFVILLPSCMFLIHRPSDLPATEFSQPGDFNLGVILPVHEASDKSMCSSNPQGADTLQKIEAVRFTVNEVNARSDILPNITMGFYILDDCSKETTALIRALHFTQSPTHQSSIRKQQLNGYDVIGVIGSEKSSNTIQVADLLSLFQIPIISYVSTSPVLSDKFTYPYFSRIVPSDVLQVSVLMDIINRFNWNYVSIVYEDGSYGLEMYKAFQKLMTANSKCIAVARLVSGVFTDAKAEHIAKDLRSASGARAVVLVLRNNEALRLLKSVKRLGYQNYFTWLGTDVWGSSFDSYKEVEDEALGALTIGFYGVNADRLHEYIKHLTPINASDNPWFNEYFEVYNDCEFEPVGNRTRCKNSTNLATGYYPRVTTSYVMDAVYTYAYSLHSAIMDCGLENPTKCVKGKKFLNVVRNVSFNGEHGLVSFDRYGDGSATYIVRTLRQGKGKYELMDIGMWDTRLRSFIRFHTENITWKSSIVNSSSFPKSQCSNDCPNGFQAIITNPQCCWYCEPCRNNEKSVTIGNRLICDTCPVFSWPDSTKTKCDQIKVSKIAYNNAVGITIMMLILIIVIGTVTCIIFIVRTLAALGATESLTI